MTGALPECRPGGCPFPSLARTALSAPWNGCTGGNMLNRRTLMVSGLSAAIAPSLVGVAYAQAGKPMLVYLGDETDAANKMWRSRSEPAFKKSDAFKKLDYRVVVA